jgi:hypothetical protein
VTAAFVLVGACVATMTTAIAWGFTAGDFRSEGAALMRMPWGVVSVIDVYVGGALVAGWIAYRERSVPRVLPWVLLIVVLGHLATSLYALAALLDSRGDPHRFWLGPRRAGGPATGGPGSSATART